MQNYHFTFPTFSQLYPYEKRKLKLLREYVRYKLRYFLFKTSCDLLIEFLNKNPLWIPLFLQKPYRTNTLLSIYCNKTFNVKQRLNAIIDNFDLAEKLLGNENVQNLISNQSIELADLTDELTLNLNINQIDPYEGFFSLNIQNKITRQSYYDASFTFLSPNKLLIASMQGPKGEDAQELVRTVTKDLHGVRPMFMLMNGFKLLAHKLNCELLGIPHKHQAKYRWNDSSKLLFNYDQFWSENNGEKQQFYWTIPCNIERKDLETIASKKRSMYRKRYQMLDELELKINQLNF